MSSTLKKCGLGVLVVGAILSHAGPVSAIDAQANDFVSAPPGTNVALMYYIFQNSNYYNNVLTGTSSKDTKLDQNVGIFRYVYYNQFFHEVPWALEFLIPFAGVTGGEIGGGHLNDQFGAGDPILGEVIWPVSNPARKQYVALAVYEYVPLGQYDPSRPISIGTNTTQVDVQLAYTQGWGHKISTDVVLDYVVHGDNTNAGVSHMTLKEKDTKEAFIWLNYDFTKTSFAAAGWFGSFGGSQTLGGQFTGAKTEYQQIRAEYAVRPTPTTQVLGEVFHDINVVGGFKYNFGFQLRGAVAF